MARNLKCQIILRHPLYVIKHLTTSTGKITYMLIGLCLEIYPGAPMYYLSLFIGEQQE